MQREQISIPKIVLYFLLVLAFYVLQTSLFGAWSFQGFRLDLLPCFVAAAALLDGPVEGLIVGLMVGVFYDLGFTGLDGVYPLFFMLFGFAAGNLSRAALAPNYVSASILTAAEMLVLGLARYFCYLLPQTGASFPLVLQQVAGGALLAAVLGFLVYLPMAKISRRFNPHAR